MCSKVLMMSEYEVFERLELGRTEMPASTHLKTLLVNELETLVLGWVEVSAQVLLKLLANESRTLRDLAPGLTKPLCLKVLLMSECEVFRRPELGWVRAPAQMRSEISSTNKSKMLETLVLRWAKDLHSKTSGFGASGRLELGEIKVLGSKVSSANTCKVS